MEPIQRMMDRDYQSYTNWRDNQDTQFKTSDFFEYVETVVPIVTNNRIRANVRSDYPDYVTHAKGLADILDNTYDINNWDYESQAIMRMALIYRSAYAYTGYDKEHKNGTGKLCITKVNGRWCYSDPAATDLEESRFFFYVEPKRKTEVFRLHPESKAEIEKTLGRDNSWSTGNNQNSWFRTFLKSVKNFLVFNQTGTQARQTGTDASNSEMSEEEKHRNVIAYIHYWYRDDEDKWRVSYWADDVFCKDEENPFWHGGLPYDIYSPIKDPMSMLGVPMSDQIETITGSRNLLMNYVIANARLHADPPILYNTTFGNVKDPKDLKREGGNNVIPVNNPDMVPLNAIAAPMLPPALPGNVVQLFDQLGNIKDKATGINDSFRGTQQATSGKEVQLQQEAAYTRIKTMIDQFELFNKKIAEKIIVNAMQFYTQTRGFRVKGDHTKYQMDAQIAQQNGEEMPFEVKPIQKGITPDGQPVHDKTEFFLYANPSEWTKLDPEGQASMDESDTEAEDSEDEDSEDEKTVGQAVRVLQMTVEIEAGSSLPQSRLARREEAQALAQMGMIDQEALLDAFDWPDREEILKRMQEQAQAKQKAEAEAAQADAQAKMQIAQMQSETQLKVEELKLQGGVVKQHMSNEVKREQKQPEGEPLAQEQDPGLAGQLDQIRQANPDAAHLTDDQLIEALTQQ